MEPIKHRYDFVLLFEVTNGNPNGDPDAGNAPRIDPETGHGLVTDVCLKRKIRDFVLLSMTDENTGKPADGFDIYVKHHGVLHAEHERAYAALGLKVENEPDKEESEGEGVPPAASKKAQIKKSAALENMMRARAWMCQTMFDVRTFGAVMSTGLKKGLNCGQVRGPVQLTFSRSVDPIAPPPSPAITRVAVTTQDKADDQIAKYGQIMSEMGRKEYVAYGLYVTHGFISPHLAADTGFSEADLNLFWGALKMMFEHDHSAARGEMASRKLVVFEHESPLGNAPAHVLFDRIKTTRKDTAKPARAYSDYEVTLDKENLPAGITVHEML
jgi:CRISPR-associated protein Csd2